MKTLLRFGFLAITIDNLHVTDDATPHTVPTGFVGGTPPAQGRNHAAVWWAW